MVYNFIIKNLALNLLLIVLILTILVIELKEIIQSKNAIKINEAIELINHKNATIIDIRTKNEYKLCSIINSINIPYNDLKKNQLIKKYKKKYVIIIHKNNKIAQNFINELKKKQFKTIFYIKDGLTEWIKNDLPLNKN